jgi:hypothetical protein
MRRFRRFRREAEAEAMIAVVRAMDFMGRRVADAMVVKGMTVKEKTEEERDRGERPLNEVPL